MLTMAQQISARVGELVAQRRRFVQATVVRAQCPTSARPGDAAIVLPDGTIEGFVGGQCAEESVRVAALDALQHGDSVLLRILPDGSDTFPDTPGAVTVHRCRSTVNRRSPRSARAARSRTTSTGSCTGRSPLATQFARKMSAKLGAMMQRMPSCSSAHTAASRDEPQPKFSPATRIDAPWYGLRFRTKSGLSTRWPLPSGGR